MEKDGLDQSLKNQHFFEAKELWFMHAECDSVYEACAGWSAQPKPLNTCKA